MVMGWVGWGFYFIGVKMHKGMEVEVWDGAVWCHGWLANDDGTTVSYIDPNSGMLFGWNMATHDESGADFPATGLGTWRYKNGVEKTDG